jgi:hypothetical protein
MLSIVFKLTHYNHEGIFSDELRADQTYSLEAQINSLIHQVITKLLLTSKDEG